LSTSPFGIGVAGNFAGHLEQAGESADFLNVAAEVAAPKGIFPFHVPGDAGFLGVDPVSSDRIVLPQSSEPLNLQIEPEVGVLFDVEYAGERVVDLRPRAIGAFNDCSIRREGAQKISEKKNWGACSKGFASELIDVTELDPEGITKSFRLASFLRRENVTYIYGIDSPLPDYSYYGTRLIDWIVEMLNTQDGAAVTPLEDVGAMLRSSGNPSRLLAAIGATRYSGFGEANFLQKGDESVVVVYDSAHYSRDDVLEAVDEGQESALVGASVLCQRVEALS
jgi:hypothetical protein